MRLEEIVVAMAQHEKDNPTHGYNCACKDGLLRQARIIYKRMDLIERQNFNYLLGVLRESV